MTYNLLIVEDEKPLRKKMVNNVDWDGNGYCVFEASNGVEALELAETVEIDVLVTDIQMPKMGGVKLVESLKARYPHVRVVVISGYAEFEYAQSFLRLGVYDYLLKPFRSVRLLEVVNATRDKIQAKRIEERELRSLLSRLHQCLSEQKLLDSYAWLVAEQDLVWTEDMESLGLSRLLRGGNREDLLQGFERIDLWLQKVFPYPWFTSVLQSFVLHALHTLHDYGATCGSMGDILVAFDPIQPPWEDMAAVQIWVHALLLAINDHITYHQGDRTKHLIEEAKGFIDRHYAKGVTLTGLAQQLNVSTGYLSRLFQEHVGMSFTEYQNQIRLDRAKELLKSRDWKVYRVADAIGFTDPFYFSSWFKRMVGSTPTEYRQSLEDRSKP